MAEDNERGDGGLFRANNQAGFGKRAQKEELKNFRLMLRSKHPKVGKLFDKVIRRAVNLNGLDKIADDETKPIEDRATAERMIDLRMQGALKAVSLVMAYSVPKPTRNRKNTPNRPANPLAALSLEELQRLAKADVEVIQ